LIGTQGNVTFVLFYTTFQGENNVKPKPNADHTSRCADCRQSENIRIRAVARFYQADKDCGLGIAKNLNLSEKAVLAEAERQKTE
jgi:catalase